MFPSIPVIQFRVSSPSLSAYSTKSPATYRALTAGKRQSTTNADLLAIQMSPCDVNDILDEYLKSFTVRKSDFWSYIRCNHREMLQVWLLQTYNTPCTDVKGCPPGKVFRRDYTVAAMPGRGKAGTDVASASSRRFFSSFAAHNAEPAAVVSKNSMLNPGTSCSARCTVPNLLIPSARAQ